MQLNISKLPASFWFIARRRRRRHLVILNPNLALEIGRSGELAEFDGQTPDKHQNSHRLVAVKDLCSQA
jgi:hypothetical protein